MALLTSSYKAVAGRAAGHPGTISRCSEGSDAFLTFRVSHRLAVHLTNVFRVLINGFCNWGLWCDGHSYFYKEKMKVSGNTEALL